MSVARPLNRARVLWGSPREDGLGGLTEPAILLHVDNGGSICLEQGTSIIILNRESLPELIRELRLIYRERGKMIYRTEFSGIEIQVTVTASGSVIFTARDVLEGRRFDSEDMIVAALKAYDLASRKAFDNPEAFVADHNRGAYARVVVTSICPGGKECWIKRGDVREKRYLADLFADREEVEAALQLEGDSLAKIREAWAAVRRWGPESKGEPS